MQGSLLRQVHGAKGWERTSTNKDQILEGDWHYSFEADTGLIICVADCTAIMIVGEGERGHFAAALHAGWRGTAQNIIENALSVLKPRASTLKAFQKTILSNHGCEILEDPRCTYCDPALVSYRRAGTDLKTRMAFRILRFKISSKNVIRQNRRADE